MKELVIFANYKEAQTMTLIMLLVFGVIIETIRYLLVKKVNVISLILNIAIFLVAMFASNVSVILVVILMCLNTFLEILYFLYKVYIELQLKGKTNDYLRNTDYDFFIQMNKKGKIAHTKAFQSMTYNQDGTVTLVNNIIGNTQIVVCQYKDEQLKVISRLVTDNSGNTKKYLINDNEVTEKEYNKVVNSYKRDNDRYRTYSYNGAEYSGYEDVSHALSALETKIQQIEQAEAEK